MSDVREGRSIRVRGQVQGVGMRPFVYRVARREGLVGSVRNDGGGVSILAGGSPEALARLERALRDEAPPLARIDRIESRPAPVPIGNAFAIVESDGRGAARTGVTIDAPTCPACRAELLDPADRRYRYPLINCTECGPRFSLLTGIPYDRPQTTMAPFPMCAACAGEYTDPEDRRYHAQPTCCPVCGPHLVAAPPGRLDPAEPGPTSSEPALAELIAVLARGGTVAVQGLGGFHLAALADDEDAVARLRAIKRRDAKPFAVMVRDAEAAEALVVLSPEGRAALEGAERPIVLADARPGARVARGIAPGSHRLGVLLPYTPIHHLLFADPRLADRPLVMTSANVSDAPMSFRARDVGRSFAGTPVDLVVAHGRAIARRVDDGIVLDAGPGRPPLPIRRARGQVPGPLPLPPGPDGLAVGGDLKNTFCLARGEEGIASAHHGDLAHRSAREAFEEEIDRFLAFFEVRPAWVACDLHPDFASTRVAERIARARGLPLLRIQHHHAHAASLLVEAGIQGAILAAVLDGFGLGDDGATWGGELLLADLRGFRRIACLAPVPAIGGDRYAREPARPALAWLTHGLGPAAADHPAAARLVPDPQRRRQLVTLGPRAGHPSHSAGRLFDAAAALLGLAPDESRFEAEAAMALEAAATRGAPRPDAPRFRLRRGDPAILDPTPLLLWLAERPPSETDDAARAFHDRLAEAVAEAILAPGGDAPVGLTGGVAVNRALAHRLRASLADAGRDLVEHRRVPPSDAGLAIGQAAIARATFDSGSNRTFP